MYQGCVSDMKIDGSTFVPKSGYFSLVWVKVCLKKLVFFTFKPILRTGFLDKMLALSNKKSIFVFVSGFLAVLIS